MIQEPSSRHFTCIPTGPWAARCDAQQRLARLARERFSPRLQEEFAVGRRAVDSQMQLSPMPQCRLYPFDFT
jgi:hypothetical protein